MNKIAKFLNITILNYFQRTGMKSLGYARHKKFIPFEFSLINVQFAQDNHVSLQRINIVIGHTRSMREGNVFTLSVHRGGPTPCSSRSNHQMSLLMGVGRKGRGGDEEGRG